MTDVSIRRLEGPAIADAIYAVQSYAYHAQLPCPPKEEWTKGIEDQKGVVHYAVYEDEQAVCVAASLNMTQNVRGRLYPVNGVGGVATLPAARRKGYVRQLMTQLLAEARAAGAVFSDLYPFRESFYERMGYVTFPGTMDASFAARALEPLLKKDFGGSLELHPLSEVVDECHLFLQGQRARTHGMALFDFFDREKMKEHKLWAAMAKFDGQVEGLMLYNMEQKEDSQTLRADRFFCQTSRARMLLLQWIALHVDQIERVKLELLAHERPITWLSDLRVKTETNGFAALGRVLDVGAMGGMQVGAGSFSARVSDPYCPLNEGVWRFACQDGKLAVGRAEQPDCDLTIQGLTAMVFGTHEPQDLPLRGWGNPAPALQDTLRTMFSMQSPYLHEGF
jgi:predicted acetyltransferase